MIAIPPRKLKPRNSGISKLIGSPTIINIPPVTTKTIRTIKDLNRLKKVSLNLKKTDLERRIRATNYKNFKPHVIFNKRKFNLVN